MTKQARLPTTIKEWHQRVLMLTWPIILSNLSIPLVGAVDTAVMGQLAHPRYMAAVAIGAIIFSSTFWIFGFLRMGTTGFVSQAYGRNDDLQISLTFFRSASIALILSAIILILHVPLGSLALHLINAEADVTALAQNYYSIRIWSAPATFLNYCILGVLIGMQRMRIVLLSQLILNGCNIGLDIAFVKGLGMDANGVALSSLFSEYIAMSFGLWMLRPQLKVLWQQSDTFRKEFFDRLALKSLFSVNSHLFIRTLLLSSAFFFFTAQGTQFGTTLLAANAVLINMLYFLSYGLDGFAQAAEALVGGAYGNKNKKAFIEGVKVTSLWALIMAVSISVIYALLGHLFIQSITHLDTVIEAANEYLIWLILAPIISVWSYQLDGIYIGATQTKVMRDTMFYSLAIYFIAAFALMPSYQNHGLWGALMLFLLMRGVFLAWHYPSLLKAMDKPLP